MTTTAGTGAAARAVQVWKVYGAGETEVVALRDVSVELERGKFTAIMGPSGSGKSTLMHCLAGLDSVSRGEVFVGDTKVTGLNDAGLTRLRRDKIGFIFQQFNLLPTLTAEENILLPLSIAGRKPDPEWYRTVIDTVHLGDRLAHRPSQLSGGQQQRVACARALVARPEVIFADEPTGNLDSRSGADVLTFLRDSVKTHGQTIVMVTHDPVAASYADRVLFLGDGAVVDEIIDPTADSVLDRMRNIDPPEDGRPGGAGPIPVSGGQAPESRGTTDPTGRTPHPGRVAEGEANVSDPHRTEREGGNHGHHGDPGSPNARKRAKAKPTARRPTIQAVAPESAPPTGAAPAAQSRATATQARTTGPQARTTGPQARTTGPEAGMAGPQAGMTGPTARITGPQAGTTGPQAGTTATQAGTTAQARTTATQARMTPTQAGTTGTQAGMSATKPQLSATQTEVAPSRNRTTATKTRTAAKQRRSAPKQTEPAATRTKTEANLAQTEPTTTQLQTTPSGAAPSSTRTRSTTGRARTAKTQPAPTSAHGEARVARTGTKAEANLPQAEPATTRAQPTAAEGEPDTAQSQDTAGRRPTSTTVARGKPAQDDADEAPAVGQAPATPARRKGGRATGARPDVTRPPKGKPRKRSSVPDGSDGLNASDTGAASDGDADSTANAAAANSAQTTSATGRKADEPPSTPDGSTARRQPGTDG